MKLNLFQSYPFFLIIFLITFFQLNALASMNPLNWFSSNDNPNEVIEVEINHEKGTQKLAKKLAKFKNKKDGKGQQKIYKKILNNHPKSFIAREAAYERGIYFFDKEEWKNSFDTFSIIKEYHPDFPELNSVIELQFKCAENLMNQKYKKLFGLNKANLYNAKSIPLFINFQKLYPYNKNAPLALLYAAKVSEDDKEYEAAIYSLKSLINNYPDSLYSAEAHFLIAHIYSDFIKGPEYDLETAREAIRYCEDFIALYPKHIEIGTIKALHEKMLNTLATNRVLLADYYYFNRRDNIAAIIFYNEAITTAPNSQAAIEAQERLNSIEMGIRPATGRNLIKKLLFIE